MMGGGPVECLWGGAAWLAEAGPQYISRACWRTASYSFTLGVKTLRRGGGPRRGGPVRVGRAAGLENPRPRAPDRDGGEC